MAVHLIHLTTDRFDPAAERPNPINPFPGEALLTWLSSELRASGYDTTDTQAEDWGWYAYTASGPMSYMLGASGEPGSGQDVHWIIAINERRSLRDRLFRRNKMLAEDELSAPSSGCSARRATFGSRPSKETIDVRAVNGSDRMGHR
ncbi:hypothetical protein HL667_16295 [Bradyrhizobium sp. 83012]|uniref:Uncharacterized protein n=1 Tax=Bradyrhizobium aeschynomenes TaxID=2734909 RepID=A0ABX2CEB7_9BRAD|nr:hypothetical protein [Bradyrhizobium aeschynomenes]NPU13233.1 hypothetical protein [Bradyrhizobium aeschynomenes]NPU66566.1 hypothetical protein [Bradyrhizobium aeschynomenes]